MTTAQKRPHLCKEKKTGFRGLVDLIPPARNARQKVILGLAKISNRQQQKLFGYQMEIHLSKCLAEKPFLDCKHSARD